MKKSFFILAAVLIIAAIPTFAQSQLGGILDRSFGVGIEDGTPDGMISVSLGPGNDTTEGAAIQSDGKILVAGSSTSYGSGTTTSNIVVVRFKNDGMLDVSFGAGNGDGSPDGVVTLNLGSGSEEGRAIAVQSDGKIIVAGTTASPEVTSSRKNIVVARLNVDGTLDPSFGADGNADGTPDGFVAISLGEGDDVANAVAIQPDGRILVAGTASSGSDSDIAIARLNRDGSLDAASFGIGQRDGSPDGIVTLSLGKGSDEALDIAVQNTGDIVVAGVSHSVSGSGGSGNIVVVRLKIDGSLDKFFGTDADGAPDGVVNISLSEGDDAASALAIQSDGKILVGGSNASVSGKNAAVARLSSSGSIDGSFGIGSADGTPDGSVSLSLGSRDDEIAAIAVDAEGKIVVVGTTASTVGSGSNVFVARLLSDGRLDAEFGQEADGTPDGVVNLSFGEGDDFGRAVAIESDGKIVVIGDRVNGSSSDIVLARLLAK